MRPPMFNNPFQSQFPRPINVMDRNLEYAAFLEMQKKRDEGNRRNQSSVQPKNSFTEVALEVQRLRQELAAGRLTGDQFKARLIELMVQDQQGTWWMVNHESGKWFRYEGGNWIQGEPPSSSVLEAVSDKGSAPSDGQWARQRKRSRWGRKLAFLFVLTLIVVVIIVLLGNGGGPGARPSNPVTTTRR